MIPSAQRKIGPTDADFDDDIEDRPVRYSRGEIGKLLKPAMTELVEHRTEGDNQQHIMGFLSWVPPEILEDFLVLALEYAADKTMPQTKPRNGRAQKRRSAV